MKKHVGLFLGLVLLVALCIPGSLMAAEYYEGKVIKIISGHEAGGGYDRVARLLAKHLPKHIPGKPSIIVENMPGASSIIAGNQTFTSKPDGLTLCSLDRGIATAELLKIEGIKFNLKKFAWVGSAAIEGTVLCVRTDLPYKTVEDVRKSKETIHLAHTGPSSSSYQFGVILKELAGFNIKMVGYMSSAPAMLAIEKKEVDGRAGAYSSIKPFIDRNLVWAVLRGRVAEEETKNLPVDEDLVTDKKAKTIMAMRSSGDLMGRPYVAPPGTPPEVMAILQNAFIKVSKDPELTADAKKMKLEIDYQSPDKIMKVLDDLFSQPQEMIDEYGKYVKF